MGFIDAVNSYLKKCALLLLTVTCIIVGVAIGIVLNMLDASDIAKLYVGNFDSYLTRPKLYRENFS